MNRTLLAKHARSCASKVYYPTRGEAEQERQRHGYRLYIYACPWCGGFHLTRQVQRRKP